MTPRPVPVPTRPRVRLRIGDDDERLVAFLRKWLEWAEATRREKVA